MRTVRQAGRYLALGILAVAVGGCATTVQPGGPAVGIISTDPSTLPAPPVATCPAKLPATLLPAPASGMVANTPSAAIACRYAGLNDPHPGALVQSAAVSGADLAKVVSLIDSAKPWPPGARSCPVDLGLSDLLVFSYSNGTQSEVRVDTSGCRAVSNGRQRVEAPQALLDELTSVVGASPPPSN